MYTKNQILLLLALFATVAFSSCDSDDPEAENVEEEITKAVLTFTPDNGGSDLTFTAIDPDGSGSEDIEVDTIKLAAGVTYDLDIKLYNTLEDPAENITEEIEEEDVDHMFFFGWTGDVFSSPTNSDITSNRSDVLYQDEDDNGNEIGLTTEWTTVASATSGTFRVVLKHQPDIKSATSTYTDGTTDFDVTFDIDVE